MTGVKNKIWFLREGLFAKYVMSLVGLVVFVLAVNGAMETWISYRATRTTLTDGMSEKAEAAARRIEQSISELERQISWVTRASSDTLEKHRADYAQLLTQAPGISQLFLLPQIVLVVAFVAYYCAIFDFQHARGQPVDEVPIMRNENDGAGEVGDGMEKNGW